MEMLLWALGLLIVLIAVVGVWKIGDLILGKLQADSWWHIGWSVVMAVVGILAFVRALQRVRSWPWLP